MSAPPLRPLSEFLGAKFSLSAADATVAMDDEEATFLLEILAGVDWTDTGCIFAGYPVRSHDAWLDGGNVAMFDGNQIVGFYEGPNLWVAPAYRRLGLAIPLILSVARLRGGGVLPAEFETQSYSPAGLLAHVSAHLRLVLCAVANKEVIPADVLGEYGVRTAQDLVNMFEPALNCCQVSAPAPP